MNEEKDGQWRCYREKGSLVLVKIARALVRVQCRRPWLMAVSSLVGQRLPSQNYQFLSQGSFWSTPSPALLNSSKIEMNILREFSNNWDFVGPLVLMYKLQISFFSNLYSCQLNVFHSLILSGEKWAVWDSIFSLEMLG